MSLIKTFQNDIPIFFTVILPLRITWSAIAQGLMNRIFYIMHHTKEQHVRLQMVPHMCT